MYWFKCVQHYEVATDEFDEDGEQIFESYRVFLIYDCPSDWWTPVLQKHEDFCRLVGEHWNYKNDVRGPAFVDNGTCGEFYAKYKDFKQPELKDDWIVGKCDSRCRN